MRTHIQYLCPKQKLTHIICVATILAFGSAISSADDWPQWRGANRDGKWTETGLLEKFPKPEIEKKWRVKIGSGYSGPTVSESKVYVMDRVSEPEQIERVLCLDEQTGKEIWKHAYPCEYRNVGYIAGPRASVTIDNGLAYSIGTMGHFKCFDATNGDVIWEHDCDKEYRISADRRMPIWGIAASPLIYENLVIVHLGTVDSSVVGFDKKNGERSLEIDE